jgi:hypothetical protein
MLIAAARERGLIGDRRWRGARYHTDSRFNSRAIATRTNDGAVFGLGDGSGRPRHRASYTAMPASPMVGKLGTALLSLPISLTAPLRRGSFTGPQMDPELRLLDLVRRDWWVLVIVLCIIWAIESHLEGNSIIETIEAPLLVVAWGGLILLIDRWALRHTRGVS